MKFLQGDVHKLIYELLSINKTKRVRTIDSWDEWKEKGYLKIAYKVNTGILAFALIAVIAHIIFKGFDSSQLLFMLLLILQMFLYQLQMKGKLKTTGGNKV
ncbi:hypothetical protein MKJ04_20155 [Pontibacter sp. E15-1]|uniref:hypothetical protein n=1 Tax=Pontibacter sp. E15-1 TaxID=2919918 RepID=UPI001F4F9EF3|nr:hypothetical protein [Pontibacter sp. E15-1]MCJ8167165.1 hypothetical protein [Pontibacter sp. E15-1]